MTRSLLMMLSLTAAVASIAQHASAPRFPYTEQQAIEYTKALDVHQLDASLPSQSLDDWLRTGPPHVEKLSWEVEDTCLIHPDPSYYADYPLCVMARIKRAGEYTQVLILIGTMKKGIIATPKLYEEIAVWEGGFVQTGDTEQLSGLPQLLGQPAVTIGVSDLYQKIAKLHPIGIPSSAVLSAIGPSSARTCCKSWKLLAPARKISFANLQPPK